MKVKRRRKKHQSYINHEALSLRRRKERLWERCRITRQDSDFINFAKLRNQLRTLIRKIKFEMENKIVSSMKTNRKFFWKYVNNP